ncbi:MAG: outer membrane protein transport protein [Prevotellaceae bacterium]|jgi:hypothetical protein|nr:outer membrane protein transport protein [Prevotellaceae bacterium]
MLKLTKWTFFGAGFFIIGSVYAQDNSSINTYSPYSMYGMGDIAQPGLTATGSMGGITTGVRESRQIDYVNPAGASARDSLTFVLDFGGEMKNFYSKTSTLNTSYNTANFRHIAFAFPVGRFGLSVGLTPFSSVGYEVEQRERNDDIVASMGDVRYLYRGEDGVNQIFLNLGFNATERWAVGAGVRYLFGSISHYYNVQFNTNAYYSNVYSSEVQKISSFVPTLGAQYTQPLDDKRRIVFGASFQPEMKLRGTRTALSQVSANAGYDTAYNSSGSASALMPMQLNLGASITATEKWMLGAEFNYQDWSKTKVINSTDAMGRSYNIRLGGYYIPNRYDVRYFWKRMTYRGGLRYSQTPPLYNGNAVRDIALNAGFSLPMRGAGYLNAGVEVGRRGATGSGMVQETYLTLSVGITLFEAWFVKYRYE